MKTQHFLMHLALLIFLSGCDKCSDTDCPPGGGFIFKLSSQKGENLLDNSSLSLADIRVVDAENPSASLYLITFKQEGDTWIKAFLDRSVSDYSLGVEGVGSYDLSFNLESSDTECCGNILAIKEAYLDGVAIPGANGGWKNITLP